MHVYMHASLCVSERMGGEESIVCNGEWLTAVDFCCVGDPKRGFQIYLGTLGGARWSRPDSGMIPSEF